MLKLRASIANQGSISAVAAFGVVHWCFGVVHCYFQPEKVNSKGQKVAESPGVAERHSTK
jgi:hypothetical protein